MENISNIENTVIRIILDIMEIDVPIQGDNHLSDDLGMDIIDYEDLMIAINYEFMVDSNIDISLEIETVADLIKYANESKKIIPG